MSSLRTIVIGALVLGALFLGRTFLGSEPDSPAHLLNQVRVQLSEGSSEPRESLRLLERARSGAEAQGDRVLVANVLSLKAEILRTLGSLSEAQVVLEQLLTEYVPENPRIDQRLAEVLAAQGFTTDALNRVANLIDREPDFAPAWRLAGVLQTERAQGYLEEALEIVHGVLLGAEAEQAEMHVRALASRAPNDPERAAHAAGLNELLENRDPVSLEGIYDKVYPASDDHALARACLARGCTDEFDGATVALLMDLCCDAGQAQLAADLGVAARYVPRLSQDHTLIASLLRALVEASRQGEVISVLRDWNWRVDFAELEFHEAACRALYEVHEGSDLWRATWPLAQLGGREGAQMGTFYQGMAQLWRGRHEEAEARLDRYVRAEQIVEPVPGAITAAWLGLAECYRELGRVRSEREALVGATLSSDEVPGEVWMRLVELSLDLPNISYAVAEERWTKALATLPQRSDEMVEQWYELGALALEEDGREVQSMFLRMEQLRQPVPNFTVGPATKVRIANFHLEKNQTRFAIRVAREVLDEHPTLVPAMDALIEGLLQRDQYREAASLLLDRLALKGRDAASLEFLERLGEENLTPEQRLQAMLADPAVTGRLTIARHSLDRGDSESALQALVGAPTQEGRSQAELTLLTGQAFLADGRFETAATRLEELREDENLADQAMALEIEARVLGGQSEPDAMLALAQALANIEELATPLALQAADRLLASPWPEAAAPLLDRLDSQPETRSGELFLRQAVLTTYGDNPSAALESLERADPYLEDGRSRLGPILLAVDSRTWSSLPELVAELRAGDFEPQLFEEAVLAIFEEQLDTAKQLADAELERLPAGSAEASDWALVASAARLLAGEEAELPDYFGRQAVEETRAVLQGLGEIPRDPREILGPLLALRRDTWRIWGAQRLSEIDIKVAPLWSLYLGAQARSLLDDPVGARRSLELLNRRFATFGPGWDAMELLIRNQGYGEAAVTRLRTSRLEALGPGLAGKPLEVAVDRAAGLALDDKLPQARKALRDALRAAEKAAVEEGLPAPTLGRDLLARLEIQLGDPEAGLKEYLRACEALPSVSDAPLVFEVLNWLEIAARSKAVQEDSIRLALTRLAERFPRDPWVPLITSRIEVEAGPSPSVVTRAVRRLVGFRERTSRFPLDSLRRESTRAFTDFLMPLAPQEAQNIVEEDLAREPGDLELWLMDARTRIARGRTEDARERLTLLTEMSSSAEPHRGLALALAKRGAPNHEVERHLDIADRGIEGTDPRSLYIRQVAALGSGKNVPPATIDHMMKLWRRRGELARDIPPAEMGMTYIRAILSRRNPADLRRLEDVVEVLIDANPEGYLRDTLRALAGMATQMGRATTRGNVEQDVEAELERLDQGEDGPKRQKREADREALRQRRLEENRAKAAELTQGGEASTEDEDK